MTSVLDFLKRKSFLSIGVAACLLTIGSNWGPGLFPIVEEEVAQYQESASVNETATALNSTAIDGIPTPFASPGSFKLTASGPLAMKPFQFPHHTAPEASTDEHLESTDQDQDPKGVESPMLLEGAEPSESLDLKADVDSPIQPLDDIEPPADMLVDDLELNSELSSPQATPLEISPLETSPLETASDVQGIVGDENESLEESDASASILENDIEPNSDLLTNSDDATHSLDLISTNLNQENSESVDQPKIKVVEGEFLTPTPKMELNPNVEAYRLPPNGLVEPPTSDGSTGISNNNSAPQSSLDFSPLPRFNRKKRTKTAPRLPGPTSGYRPFAAGNAALNPALKPLSSRRILHDLPSDSGGDFPLKMAVPLVEQTQQFESSRSILRQPNFVPAPNPSIQANDWIAPTNSNLPANHPIVPQVNTTEPVGNIAPPVNVTHRRSPIKKTSFLNRLNPFGFLHGGQSRIGGVGQTSWVDNTPMRPRIKVDQLFLTRDGADEEPFIFDATTYAVVLTHDDLDSASDNTSRYKFLFQTNGGSGYEFSYFELDEINHSQTVTNATPVFFGGSPALPSPAYDLSYNSSLTNFEFNVWRRISQSFRYGFGIRHVALDEEFNTLESGTFNGFFADTQNELFGAQFVAEFTRQIWWGLDFEIGTRAGFFNNDADVHFVSATRDIAYEDSDGATVVDLNVGVSIALSRHFKLRGGYQAMFLDGIALAPNQSAGFPYSATSAPGNFTVATYDGAYLGGAFSF